MELETINKLYLELSQIATATTEREKRLLIALNPSRWDNKMHDAWHTNLPDTQKAFDALLEAALRKAYPDAVKIQTTYK